MFGLGFSEIIIIAVIAVLFLGPDKLPSALIEVAKFFKNTKNAISNVKESIEQEMNVSDIKKEALAYKQQLLEAQEKLEKVTDTSTLNNGLRSIGDDILADIEKAETKKSAKEIEQPIEKKEEKDV